MTNDWILSELLKLQDPDYKAFHSRLMPTVDPDRILGVRTPALRQLAARLADTPQARAFLAVLPHNYYEENNLHALFLEKFRDYSALIAALDRFLPFVDNWATCDLMSPRIFRQHRPELLAQIRLWLASDSVYTVRFALRMLMNHFLEEDFDPSLLHLAAAIRSDEYYINMMLAWYFATALAKQYEAARSCLEQRLLAPWVHNKAIRKAIESRRITPEQKKALRSLKIKAADLVVG